MCSMPLNYALNSAEDGKLYVMCSLPQFKRKTATATKAHCQLSQVGFPRKQTPSGRLGCQELLGVPLDPVPAEGRERSRTSRAEAWSPCHLSGDSANFTGSSEGGTALHCCPTLGRGDQAVGAGPGVVIGVHCLVRAWPWARLPSAEAVLGGS